MLCRLVSLSENRHRAFSVLAFGGAGGDAQTSSTGGLGCTSDVIGKNALYET